MKTFSLVKLVSISLLLITGGLVLTGCNEATDSVPASAQNYCDSPIGNTTESLATFIAPYERKLQQQTAVYVLEQGSEAMMSRAWLTDHAEHSIDIQYFIFSIDNVGLIATDHLVRAAERGVKVRVLVDDIMLEAQGYELLMLAAHENISIKIYNPNANVGKNLINKLAALTTDFHGFNQRMHNKVFLVDGKIAITGGRNIADEYFGFDHSYNFRDRDVFLAGQVIGSIETSFAQYWASDLSVPVQQLVDDNPYTSNPDFSTLHSYACNPENFHPDIRRGIAQVPHTFNELMTAGKFVFLDKVEYIADAPGKNDKSAFLSGGSITRSKLIELAQSAKDNMLIQTPYLVTTKDDRKFLKQLVDKGISIKILTNSLASNDNLEAFSGYQRNRKALLKTGVEIYEFKPDAKIRQQVMSEHMHKRLANTPIFGLHAKTMTIDNDITVIGTYNFDPRSAHLNTESLVIIHSDNITRDVNSIMIEEMAADNAWRISKEFNPDDQVELSKRIGVKIRRIVPKSIL